MGIGFGPGSDMMGAYNSNRKQLKRSRNLSEVREGYGFNEKNNKQASKEQLTEFRLKLQEQKRKETIRMYLVLGVITIAFGVGMFYFLFG